MRGIAALLITVPFWLSAIGQESANDREQLRIYPWSERSPTVRVSKVLLREISIPSVRTKTRDPFEFGVAPGFINTFMLEPSEVEKISKAMADAHHEYRMMEMQRLAPLTEPAPVLRMLEPGDQVFHFRLTPFPEEASAIRKQLGEAVAAAIGAERAGFFFKNAGMLDSHMREFTADPNGVWSRAHEITFTYVLTAKGNHPVKLYTRSGPHGALDPLPGSLDRYAPESVRPLLAQWRERSKQRGEKGVVARQAEASDSAAAPVASDGPKWDETVPYVDLPKAALQMFWIPGLTRDETLTPEIAALLGLTEREQKAVMELYSKGKEKFEELERANLRRVEPGKDSFVLKAFPKESAALKSEWRKELAGLVGADRGRCLEQAIKQYPSPRRGPPKGPGPMARFIPPTKLWLHRGTDEVRVDFKKEAGADGNERFRYELQSGGPGGGRGSGDSLKGWTIPPGWKHLVTPEMLGAPLVL